MPHYIRQIASHLFKIKELKQMMEVFLRHGTQVYGHTTNVLLLLLITRQIIFFMNQMLAKLDEVADSGKAIDISDLSFR